MKFSLILLLLLFYLSGVSQDDCPAGSETKNVKCHNTIGPRCVPSNYECKLCWAVEYAPCAGKTLGGLFFYSSYKKAESSAKYEAAKKNTCPLWENTKYIIYLDDAYFCGDRSATANKDFVNHFWNLYDSWKWDLANSIAQYRGYAGLIVPPALTSTTREWAGEIQAGFRRSEELKKTLIEYSSSNTSALEEKIRMFENEAIISKNKLDTYQSQLITKKPEATNWIPLPDGYSYKIAQNGSYSFFDGYDVMESFNSEQGEKELAKHKGIKTNQNVNPTGQTGASSNFNTSTENDNDVIKNLQNLYETLSKQIIELKKDGITPEIQELEKQLEKLRLEIRDLQKEN